MGGGEVEMVEEIFHLGMGMIHPVVDRLLVEDVVEDRTELEDPRQVQTSIAAKIATLICFLELEMMFLRRKGALEVEIIPLVGGIISPTGVVLEMVEIIPPTIWEIICRSRRRIWPSMGQDPDIQGETRGKGIMVGVVAGVMRNRMRRMKNLDTMMIMVMIMMVMVMRKLMTRAWVIKIRGENQKAKKEIGQEIGLGFLIWRSWIGEMMRKMRVRERVRNMEMEGLEIGKIGVRTEQVPRAALSKCSQE
jgi:hypothetical protein